MSVTVETACTHCAKPMTLEIDSDLHYRVEQTGCAPVVFVPDVDLFRLDEENIIDTF